MFRVSGFGNSASSRDASVIEQQTVSPALILTPQTSASRAARRLTVTGEQWDLSGEGLYNRAQAATIRGAVGVTRTYRFVVSEPTDDAVEDGFYEGPAMLTNLQLGGSDGEFGSVALQIVSDGGWAWEAAA